ncbi:transmembrane protein 43 homolog [Coccinella septempunctata]|uniref:transmembrane protein 43 homolog n=1 Tax=Coccinella septempunctata TaxID=41139 RepID=UPI001D07334A|nr:transmembrane protein 43 homolog [Coccinella septempunctata]
MNSISDEFYRSWLTSIIGIALFCTGVWLLTWNEGRAVHHADILDEAYNSVLSLNSYESAQREYDGELIHISGPIIVEEPLTEPDYGISIQSVKLKRRVQMYQWVEEVITRSTNEMGSSSDIADYHYDTEWRDKLVDSSSFYIRHGHQNPIEMPLKTHTYLAPFVRVGRITLGKHIKKKFNDFVEVTSDERPDNKNIKLHLGIYYHCEDVWNPEVGDIRVQFYYAGLSGDPVTVIAMQKDGILVPYVTSKGQEIALIRHGILSVDDMFSAEHSDAKIETWKYRALGMFILYASSVCLARLLRIAFNNMPMLRGMFSEEISNYSNLMITLSVALFVIAMAWIAYRPMLGVALLMAAISPFMYCSINLYNMMHLQNGYHNR